MTSSVPKPPKRIRVEMPAEIAPQPVPGQLLNDDNKPEEATAIEKAASNKIHISHPRKMEIQPELMAESMEVEAAIATSGESPVAAETELPVVENREGEMEAVIAVSGEQPAVTNEMPAEETGKEEIEAQQANALPTVISVPSDEELFKKHYYTIGEVADMFGANQSQIRFWENEFEILQPKKNKKGDRYFRPEDVKNLVLIRHLLQERRFTIEGAKEYLKGQSKRLADRHQTIQQLEKLKGFLMEMKANLGEAV